MGEDYEETFREFYEEIQRALADCATGKSLSRRLRELLTQYQDSARKAAAKHPQEIGR